MPSPLKSTGKSQTGSLNVIRSVKPSNGQSSGSEQIKMSVLNLNEITQEISAASTEQYTGAEQVVKTIERVKDMVHQNSSSAVELLSSAEQLNQQANSLQRLVDRLVLNGSGRVQTTVREETQTA